MLRLRRILTLPGLTMKKRKKRRKQSWITRHAACTSFLSRDFSSASSIAMFQVEPLPSQGASPEVFELGFGQVRSIGLEPALKKPRVALPEERPVEARNFEMRYGTHAHLAFEVLAGASPDAEEQAWLKQRKFNICFFVELQDVGEQDDNSESLFFVDVGGVAR